MCLNIRTEIFVFSANFPIWFCLFIRSGQYCFGRVSYVDSHLHKKFRSEIGIAVYKMVPRYKLIIFQVKWNEKKISFHFWFFAFLFYLLHFVQVMLFDMTSIAHRKHYAMHLQCVSKKKKNNEMKWKWFSPSSGLMTEHFICSLNAEHVELGTRIRKI